MYLNAVLGDLQKTKVLHAEHLYKLNEAVFNLPEDDTTDNKIVSKIFKVLEDVRNMYKAGKVPKADPNFFYDYLALLGTMQNQHFFSQKQTESLLAWIREAVQFAEEAGGPGFGKEFKVSKKGAGNANDLEAQNRELKKEVQKLEKYKKVVENIKALDNDAGADAKAKKGKKQEPEPVPEPQTKKKKKKGSEPEPQPIAKGKGKGKEDSVAKGKGKSKGKEEPVTKGKGKDKGKKGKGKYVDDSDDEYDPPTKSKGKAGSTGKAKGKGKDEPVGKSKKGKGKSKEPEYYPPMHDAKGKKGKGKGKKGESKGKGYNKGYDNWW
jgi:hypothetical protein